MENEKSKNKKKYAGTMRILAFIVKCRINLSLFKLKKNEPLDFR